MKFVGQGFQKLDLDRTDRQVLRCKLMHYHATLAGGHNTVCFDMHQTAAVLNIVWIFCKMCTLPKSVVNSSVNNTLGTTLCMLIQSHYFQLLWCYCLANNGTWRKHSIEQSTSQHIANTATAVTEFSWKIQLLWNSWQSPTLQTDALKEQLRNVKSCLWYHD